MSEITPLFTHSLLRAQQAHTSFLYSEQLRFASLNNHFPLSHTSVIFTSMEYRNKDAESYVYFMGSNKGKTLSPLCRIVDPLPDKHDSITAAMKPKL